MKKYQINLVGIVLIGLALYLGLHSIDITIEVKPNTTINDTLTEKLYQDKLKNIKTGAMQTDPSWHQGFSGKING